MVQAPFSNKLVLFIFSFFFAVARQTSLSFTTLKRCAVSPRKRSWLVGTVANVSLVLWYRGRRRSVYGSLLMVHTPQSHLQASEQNMNLLTRNQSQNVSSNYDSIHLVPFSPVIRFGDMYIYRRQLFQLHSCMFTIHMYSGITSGRVLDGELLKNIHYIKLEKE